MATGVDTKTVGPVQATETSPPLGHHNERRRKVLKQTWRLSQPSRFPRCQHATAPRQIQPSPHDPV